MKLIVVGLPTLAVTLAASSAVAATSPAGQVESLRVDPAAASHGAAVQATVEVTNPGDKRSKQMNLLLKLRAPDGESGLLLTSQRVGKLKAGQSRTVELAAFVPDGAPSGDSTLVACRAKKGSADACGVSRQQTPLRVLTPANLRISPGAHTFESHATGTTSPTRTFTVTNTGETASQPIATSFTGADPSQFAKSDDGCDGRALAPAESCEVNAAFSPTSTGAKSGGLRASTAESNATAALTGTGITPANLTVSPTPHGFGTHATGTTSGGQTFTVTNTGQATSGSIGTSLAGADPGQFAKSADNCNGQTLAPGASCTMSGAFAPTSVGAKSADLGATATPGGTATANLTGTGATPANLTISPSPHDFGNVVNNTTSPTQTFTVTNNGGVPSGTIATLVAGTDPAQFTKSADNCNGQTLAPGASCTVNAAFAPTSSGAKSASLDASAAPGGTAGAALTGTGQTAAQLELTPSSEDFGTVVQGDQSAIKTFTVTNTGEQTTGALTISRIGPQGTQFSINSNTCGPALAHNATCTIDLRWNPTAPFTGDPDASLGVGAVPGGFDSATLNGTAITPANLTLSPTSWDFGNVLRGTGSQIKQFTLTNTGEQAATLTSIVASDRFTLLGTTCTGTLAGGQSCGSNVRFSPQASDTGPITGTVQVNASVGGSPSASVSGTAVTTPANLQIGITPNTTPPSTFGSSASADLGTTPPGMGHGVSARVWLKNTGEADAVISNSPVPITRSNTLIELFPASQSTCGVDGTPGVPSTTIPFSNLVIAGGATCSFPLRVIPEATGPGTAQFTITGSPGGSVTASFTINGS